MKNELRVIGVSKEVAFCDRLDFVVEEFESVFVRKLDDIVFQSADAFKQLGRYLNQINTGTTYTKGVAKQRSV